MEVRVIDQNGENLGVIKTTDAISKARKIGLDLVEVSSGAKPSVCKILDYKKYIYNQKVKTKESKPKKTDRKEFKLSPKIGEGDLSLRIRRGREFLEAGNMVKYTVKFKGRESKYPEIGETKLKIIESELSDISSLERNIEKKGRFMSMTLMPKKS